MSALHDDHGGDERDPTRALRTKRTQSRRQSERDPLGNMDPSDEAGSDDSDDATYGKSTRRGKVGHKRRRSSLQSVAQRLMPNEETVEAPAALDADFVALTDLKGATPDTVVGRRMDLGETT